MVSPIPFWFIHPSKSPPCVARPAICVCMVRAGDRVGCRVLLKIAWGGQEGPSSASDNSRLCECRRPCSALLPLARGSRLSLSRVEMKCGKKCHVNECGVGKSCSDKGWRVVVMTMRLPCRKLRLLPSRALPPRSVDAAWAATVVAKSLFLMSPLTNLMRCGRYLVSVYRREISPTREARRKIPCRPLSVVQRGVRNRRVG